MAEGKFQILGIHAGQNGRARQASSPFGVFSAHQMAVAGVLIPELSFGRKLKPLFYTLVGLHLGFLGFLLRHCDNPEKYNI